MPAVVKSEAIVLRSIRYGEADRILHLYTPMRGRVSAIAKGVRKAQVALRRPARALLPHRRACSTRGVLGSPDGDGVPSTVAGPP